MTRVTQFVIRGENKPGVLAQICTELAKVAVNITGILASEKAGQGIPMVVEPHAIAAKVLDTLKIPYGEEQGLAVGLTDRPGALGRGVTAMVKAPIAVSAATFCSGRWALRFECSGLVCTPPAAVAYRQPS